MAKSKRTTQRRPSVRAEQLQVRLSTLAIGETVTYAELTKLIGRDGRGNERSDL